MNKHTIERDKPLILVVDDELVGRIYIEKALQSDGYDVITAENGQQAVDLVGEQAPDMIVMDVMMPVMDGYTACRAIRKNENEIHVPIVMLTGLDDVESVEKSFAAGATDFVVKPMNLPIFKQRVRYGVATHETDLELYKQQKEIRYLAYYDSLTDLPNRILFCNRLKQAIDLANGRKAEVAILMIDLDRFKNINESLGHNVGDEFLGIISKSLKKAIGSVGQLGKFGGVKFGLFIEGDTSTDIVAAVSDKMLNILSKTYEVKGNELVCTGSIGIVNSSLDNHEVELLIRQADRAMSESKKNGGNQFSFYSKKMKSYAHHLLTIERELRKAIKANELVLYYQPKCSVETGRIKGMEALIRWHHPERGLVPPNDFISVAEETGLVILIGKWVLEEACKQTVKWHQEGFDDLVVSVNVSVRQFHHKGFVDEVLATLEDSGINSRCVDLEITESCTMNSFEKATRLLSIFREKGIRISMDDFGTGFSSLSFLQKLPLDTLKVDRAFIKDIGENGENGELAKLIIAVAKELKLSVVAEGIETEDHLDFLKKGGCDEFQGYLTSPALPAEQFEELLITNLRETHSQDL